MVLSGGGGGGAKNEGSRQLSPDLLWVSDCKGVARLSGQNPSFTVFNRWNTGGQRPGAAVQASGKVRSSPSPKHPSVAHPGAAVAPARYLEFFQRTSTACSAPEVAPGHCSLFRTQHKLPAQSHCFCFKTCGSICDTFCARIFI